MEKKQSSVDWLISQLQKSKDWHRVLNEISQMSSARVDIIEQAKAMHRDEIDDAYWFGYGDHQTLDMHDLNEIFEYIFKVRNEK